MTVALVTGAGRGIGRAIAHALAAEGADLVLAARGAEEIGALRDELERQGGTALAVVADVTDEASVEALVAQAVERFGRLDVLVTCAAAAASSGPTESLALEDWNSLLATDLTGVFLCCRAAAHPMLARRHGRIVNLASFHTVATYPERAAYVAAKTGVVGLTQALAVEWGGRGITVNAVAPGPIRTDRTAWFLDNDSSAEAGMVGRTPTGRLGDPDDVAATVAFLCSDRARHVNGQTVVVDGGWTRNAWWGSHPFGA